MNQNIDKVSVMRAIYAISDEKGLSLFRAVAASDNYDSSNLKEKLDFTRKQFYLHMKRLIDAGLLARTRGKYHLTSFGLIVFAAQKKIKTGVENYYKLKAIDSLEDSNGLPVEEHKKLVDELIDNQEIKDILVPANYNNNKNNKKFESAQPSLDIAQQQQKNKNNKQQTKQTNRENKKTK
jgi:predicted transcriptional regulator